MTFILLDEYKVKIASKYLHVYPQITPAINFHQRNFFLQWMVVNTKTDN